MFFFSLSDQSDHANIDQFSLSVMSHLKIQNRRENGPFDLLRCVLKILFQWYLSPKFNPQCYGEKIIHNHRKRSIFLDMSFSHVHYSKSELSFMTSSSLWRDGPWYSVPAHSQGPKREIDIVIIVIDYMNLLSTFPFGNFIHRTTCRNINLESVWFVN